jgi:hypothetical protein
MRCQGVPRLFVACVSLMWSDVPVMGRWGVMVWYTIFWPEALRIHAPCIALDGLRCFLAQASRSS